jgi:hypothetical protein
MSTSSSDDGSTVAARIPLAQDALVQVIASSTTGASWIAYTASPTVVMEDLRRGVPPAGATTPVLVSVAPVELAAASDAELVRLAPLARRGWVAAADLRAAGLHLVDVRIQVHGNRHARRAAQHRERGA